MALRCYESEVRFVGDLIEWIISEQEATIQQLHNYVAGKYSG